MKKIELRNFKDTKELMYRTCIELIHKHEIKSKKKNAPKDQKTESQNCTQIISIKKISNKSTT